MNVVVLLKQVPDTKDVEIDKKNNRFVITYIIEGSRDSMNKIVKDFYKEPWFESIKVE